LQAIVEKLQSMEVLKVLMNRIRFVAGSSDALVTDAFDSAASVGSRSPRFGSPV
jgi:hypothetical protein